MVGSQEGEGRWVSQLRKEGGKEGTQSVGCVVVSLSLRSEIIYKKITNALECYTRDLQEAPLLSSMTIAAVTAPVAFCQLD
jgi:hypothetical protein